MITIVKDQLRASVEAASGGQKTILYNDKGQPGEYFILPKFRYEDLGFDTELGTGVCSAFIVDDTEKNEIFIGAYPATIMNSRAVPMAGIAPSNYMTFDQAKAYCENNGSGFHMLTRHEWAAISLWCMANSFEPRGNTNYGRSYDATYDFGRRADGNSPGYASGTALTLNGSGPASWRHNNSFSGIADLVGNIWKWTDGLKLVDGRVLCTEDNTYWADEDDWTAQNSYLDSAAAATFAADGSSDISDVQINSSLANADISAVTGNDGGLAYLKNTWSATTLAGGYAGNQLLKRLLIEPADILPAGAIYARPYGERMLISGGGWGNAGVAGLAAADLINARSSSHGSIGVLPAFIG